MLDFREIQQDGGVTFELLARELLFGLGMRPTWSGQGPDGGRDLICEQVQHSLLPQHRTRWLVSCKHFAHSGKAVGVRDVEGFIDACSHHDADGFLLVCSTHPSSAVVERLERIGSSRAQRLLTHVWDAVTLERLLKTPSTWPIAQQFFPKSAGGWKLYATERPNHWVANFRGYYFHLSNRVESDVPYWYLENVEARIDEMESVQELLPSGHLLRPRTIWYDDKNGGFVWSVDYLYPNSSEVAAESEDIEYALRTGYAREDGQVYTFYVRTRSYAPGSEHHHQDHYRFYEPLSDPFGPPAIGPFPNWQSSNSDSDVTCIPGIPNDGFKSLVAALDAAGFIEIIRATDAAFESMHLFGREFDWGRTIQKLGRRMCLDQFFSAQIVLSCPELGRLSELLVAIPQEVHRHFSLERQFSFLPEVGLVEEECDEVYKLSLSVFVSESDTHISLRRRLEDYMSEAAEAVLARSVAG